MGPAPWFRWLRTDKKFLLEVVATQFSFSMDSSKRGTLSLKIANMTSPQKQFAK